MFGQSQPFGSQSMAQKPAGQQGLFGQPMQQQPMQQQPQLFGQQAAPFFGGSQPNSLATALQTPAFTFGSSTQAPAPAFGAPMSLGSQPQGFGGSGFGGATTGGLGSQQTPFGGSQGLPKLGTTSAFGQMSQTTQASGPQFGGQQSMFAFGNDANKPAAFGFGQQNPGGNTGFLGGSQPKPQGTFAFAQPNQGQTGTFGDPNSQINLNSAQIFPQQGLGQNNQSLLAQGDFASKRNPGIGIGMANPFGQNPLQGSGSNPFGQSSQNLTVSQPFGQSAAPQSMGIQPFGAGSLLGNPAGGFGQTNSGFGSFQKEFEVTENGKKNKVMSILHMPAYESKSAIRLRLEDYICFKDNVNNVQNLPAGQHMKNYLSKIGNQSIPLAAAGGPLGGSIQPVFGTNPSPLEQRGQGSMSQVPSSLVFNQQPTAQGLGQQQGSQLFNRGPTQSFSTNPFGQQPAQGSNQTGFMTSGLNLGKPATAGPFQSTGLGLTSSNPLGGQPGFGNQQQGQSGLNLGQPTPAFQSNQNQQLPTLGNLFPQSQTQTPGFPSLTGNTGGLFDTKPSAFPGLGQPQSQPMNQMLGQPQQAGGNTSFLQFPGQGGLGQQQIAPQGGLMPAGYPQPQPQPGQAGTLNFGAAQPNPSAAAQGVLGEILPMLGKVQNGSFAIYCVPLSQGQTPENRQSLIQDFESSNREIEAAIQRMSLRSTQVPTRSFDRPAPTSYSPQHYEFSERDDFAFAGNSAFDPRQGLPTRPQSHAQKFSILRGPQALSRFGAKAFSKNLSQNLVSEKIESDGQISVTVEYQDSQGGSSTFTERFRPGVSIADIVRFMMEQKKLLHDRDLPLLDYTLFQRKLTFVDRLKDVGYKDGDVLLITQQGGAFQAFPILTKPGYSVRPSIQELRKLTLEEQSGVSDFSIRTAAVEIYFTEPVDVRNADLDKIFQLEDDAVEIYPKKLFPKGGPPRGEGFNVPGKLIKFRAVPAPVKKIARIEERLREMAEDQNLEFESLNPETGDVVFSFSELH